MNRVLLFILLGAALVATIAAVALIGATGLVLLVLVALVALALVLDARLTRRVRDRPGAAGSRSAVPQAHVETDEATPLGANDEQHDDLSSVDFPRDSPAYEEVRRQEQGGRR